MDLESQRRKNAYRKLAGSGVILLLLFIGYIILIRSLDPQNQITQASQNVEIKLPVLHTLGSLSLTNQVGESIGLDSLRGKPWFANIIFTRCPGPCAQMTKQMRLLQAKIPEESKAQFVSISTDPEFDTPDVLQQYARKFKADTNTWSFLTGTKEEIFRVATKELLLVLIEKEEAKRESENDIFLHSTLTVLVDGLGRIRGSYEMLEEGALEIALKDLRLLESELL
ncbi:MAG: SCO family protein [Verrucomicrobia bacterium]|jgi:protein SCO1|nr:SCO family protein [Verrucomicrobiota bacterium]